MSRRNHARKHNNRPAGPSKAHIKVFIQQGMVFMSFDRPIAWTGMSAEESEVLGNALVKQAQILREAAAAGPALPAAGGAGAMACDAEVIKAAAIARPVHETPKGPDDAEFGMSEHRAD